MPLRREPYRTPAQETVPVTIRALEQRINKMLLPRGKILKHSRPTQRPEYGDYFVVDLVATNGIYVERKNINLERYARELGLLKPFERLEGK